MSAPNFFKAWTELRHLPRTVWVTSAAALINRLGTMALPFLTLFLIRERGYATTQAGLFLSLYGATALFAAPISGRLVDRFGAKRVMVSSFIATSSVVILVPWTQGTALLALAIFLWALSNETFRPAMMTNLSGSVGAGQRKQAFALNRWAVNLGMSVGPAVGGLLVVKSFKLVFLVDGLSSLAAVLVLAFLLPESPPAPKEEKPLHPFAPLLDPRLAVALLALLPLSALFFQMDATVPLLVVQHLGLTPATYGLMVAVNTVMIVFLEIPLNHASAAWSHRRTMVAGALFTAVGFGMYGFASGFPSLALATSIWTVGEMIGSPGISAYVSEIAPPSRRGAYMGVFMMTWSVAFIVAPWAGTQLFAHLGARLIWPMLAGLGVLSALVFARLPSGAPAEIPAASPSEA
ncbi:MAG: MFS transporter [Deltaproteobacteria bacterium]|nr:MFS transporter [Deltaproteobacteria bacterium]